MSRVIAAALLAAAVVAVLVTASGDSGHEVSITVPKATGIISGQHVREAGRVVGEVAAVKPADQGRRAKVTLELDDDAWPLTEGDGFRARWGGTINLFNRHIAIVRGPGGGSQIPEGATLPASALALPVEYGELLNVFDRKLRADTKAMLDSGGAALRASGPQLRRTLGVAPPAVGQADRLLAQVDDSRTDLDALVRSTSRVVDAIDTADPGLGELVRGAGTTLQALATEASGLRATLDDAPATFRNVRGTLGRADGTLAAAQTLLRRLAPGVSQLRRVAPPLSSVMGTLTAVGPDARATLATAGSAAPGLTRLLGKARALAPTITGAAKQAEVAMHCIRPYSPEIASLGTLWSSALSHTDGKDKFIRANVEAFIPAMHNVQYGTPHQLIAKNPGLTYAFPRPPGTQAGQPWFLPECGAGPDALDPSKDPEARNFNPLMQMPPLGPPRAQRNGR